MNRFGLANVLFSFVLVSATACRNTPDNPEDTGSPWDTGEEVVPEDPEDPLPENLFQVKEDLRWDEDITLGTVWMIPEGITLSIAAVSMPSMRTMPSATNTAATTSTS